MKKELEMSGLRDQLVGKKQAFQDSTERLTEL